LYCFLHWNKSVSDGSQEQENKAAWQFTPFPKEKLQGEGDVNEQKIGSKKEIKKIWNFTTRL